MNIRLQMVEVGLVASLLATCLSGCAPPPKSGWGFTLPKGDREQGKATYVSMHCNSCHTIPGIDQLEPAVEGEQPGVSVALGGEVVRIKTYGELVTSIINPSHRLPAGYPKEEITEDGESKMPNYNDVMTVKQLTDLVAFLQSEYEIIPIDPTYYPIY